MQVDCRSRRALDLVCLSHLRWSFVFQRPQHLMTRRAKNRRAFFVEEPEFRPGIHPRLHIETSRPVRVVVPHLPDDLGGQESREIQRRLLDDLLPVYAIRSFVAWYYTPMALAFTDNWSPNAVVYDCMDELSAFKGAPAGLKLAETNLMRRASLVLTGGHLLFKAKRHAHDNVHSFPSSADVAHFSQASERAVDPVDQASIPHPRLEFIGVIDERMDLALIDGIASARPDWQIVMVGPVVKIDPHSLPRRPNVRSLGPKTYQELPSHLAGWDVALVPFARNESTRYISPTKTPEYLAAGRPVVSTSIADVVEPYGTLGLVRIADEVSGFVGACAAALADKSAGRLARAAAFLRTTSWDDTWTRIDGLIEDVIEDVGVDERELAARGTNLQVEADPLGDGCSTISS